MVKTRKVDSLLVWPEREIKKHYYYTNYGLVHYLAGAWLAPPLHGEAASRLAAHCEETTRRRPARCPTRVLFQTCPGEA